MAEERESGKVRLLIEMATNSTSPEIDARLLKSIKSVVRYSDFELQLAAHTLMDLMKRDHSQVRYLALLIIDELFMRSKIFRTLVVENMDHLLSLSIGFRRTMPLPAPASVATVLRSKAMEFLEKWNSSYGIHYRQIRLGFEYLKNTLRFQFPNIQANAARIEQERRDREIRSKNILLSKYETLTGNVMSIKDEIQLTIDEIGECLEILRTDEQNMPLGHLEDDEIEEFRSSELRQIRIDSIQEGERVHESNDNKVVFDAMRDLYKLLVTRHLVSVREWITVIVRVEVTDNRLRNNMLREFIDFQNRIQFVKKKCEELGCSIPSIVSNEEEDFWEEGTIKTVEHVMSGAPNIQNEELADASTSKKLKGKAHEHGSKFDNQSKRPGNRVDATKSSSLKVKLADEAPVMKWGSFLDNWGSNRDVLANQRGLELESHWGRVDHDAVIPGEKIAELNVQATIYEEQPVEIQPCRAPLRKGGFCERRDLKACPFHGPILLRDEVGIPINQASRDLAPDSMEELAKQAVKNVRGRDKEELKKKEYDKQTLKRAKLAKVREHNSFVLRDAAMASTSRSAVFGVDLEPSNEEKSSTKNKKQTLASMLRKKVTTKDRISQRLLNTRARDATTSQMNLSDDSTYREAFPNQW